MITGKVTDGGVPLIALRIADTVYSGIIDTGFNGDLELPRELRSQVNARFLCRAKSLLAGGITIEDDLFIVDFPFDGNTIRAHASFVEGDEVLIGTRLLADYRLSINFVAKKVRIQRLR